MKSCNKCQVQKSLDNFGKNAATKDGLKATCRACERLAYAAWSKANPGEQSRRNKKWLENNKDRNREIQKMWKKNNPEKVKVTRNRWRKTNPSRAKDLELQSRFGITIEKFNEMFSSQHGACAICNTHQSKFTKSLHVDHDHKTGAVRGLLCVHCNSALGHLRDNELLIQNALAYLRRSRISLVENEA